MQTFWDEGQVSGQEALVHVERTPSNIYSSSSIPGQQTHPHGTQVVFSNELGHYDQIQVTQKEILRRLYHDLNQTSNNVQAIIALVYNWTLTPNQFQIRIKHFGLGISRTKSNPQGIPEVTHARRKNQPILLWFDKLQDGPWVSTLQQTLTDKIYYGHIPTSCTPDVYLFLERMLASVHDYILALFNGHKGLFSSTSALDPTGATSIDRKWKYLSDQVWGAGSLAREGNKEGSVIKLRGIVNRIDNVIHLPSAQMMVRIWRICRYLVGMGKSLNDPGLIKTYFVNYFRDLLMEKRMNHTPSFRLFDALSMIESDSLMHALRIGHLRAMHSFEAVIGTGHPVILSMWVYYAHQWKPTYGSQNMIMEYYHLAQEAADRELGPASNTAISIFHDYLYFVYYNVYNRNDERAYHLAFDLYNRIKQGIGLGPCTWSCRTQYFTFASKILARVAYRLDHRPLAKWYLEEVIELFWDSDTECRVRAVKCLRQLAIWLRKWNEAEEMLLVQNKEELLKRSLRPLLGPHT